MRKLKPEWVKTDIPKDARIKLWRLMKDNLTFDTFHGQLSKHYDEIFIDVSKRPDKYGSMSRDTYNALTYEIVHMPLEEVETLPLDLQAWVVQIRPDLKENLELPKQRKTFEVIPRDLIPKIEKLAKELERLIIVPETERPLLTDAQRKGNADFSLEAARTIANAFWWCTDPSVHVYLELNIEQQGLFDRFINLATSQGFKTIYNDWESKTNRYLDLVRARGGEEKIKAAYEIAKNCERKAHHELWEAVDALRWPNEILVSTKAK